MKPRNPLLQKIALDAWFEQINEPDYAIHQHHSDPSYTTQNGKNYAGRNTTEPESGALKDGISADLLSVELGKQAKVPKPAGYIGPLYHGTRSSFDQFELPENLGYEGLGMYFGNLKHAEGFSWGTGANVRPVYLKIDNPLRVRDRSWKPKAIVSELEKRKIFTAEQYKQIVESTNFEAYKLIRKWLDVEGYDAIVYRDSTLGMGDSYIVWHPEQVKSAIVRSKSASAGNPHVTPMPSAPAPVDPEDATFFKESDELTPAEKKISDLVSVEGFNYGARVDDGTTLWFRGNNERLVYDPKTSRVVYIRAGQIEMVCPINRLKDRLDALSSQVRTFHETLKKELGQDKKSAIRPSPHAVFENKVDKSTGQQPAPPQKPDDDDVEDAKETLENAGVGDQIGMNASKTASKYGDKLKRLEERRGEKVAAPFISEIPEGWHVYDADGNEVKTSAVTKSYGTGTPSGGTPNDPSIDAEDDEEEKTANIKGVLPRAAAQAKKRADIGIKETPKFLPPRDDIRRHLDEDVQDEVMEGVDDEQSKVAGPWGRALLPAVALMGLGGQPNQAKPQEPRPPIVQQQKAPPVTNPDIYITDERARSTTKQTQREIEKQREQQQMQQMHEEEEERRAQYSKVTHVASDPDEAETEFFLDEIRSVRNEAKEVFLEDSEMQQVAQDAAMTMDQLWEEVGDDFVQNYYESAYAKQGSIAVSDDPKCPICKSMKGKAVEDGLDDTVSLRECLTCGAFYQV